MNKPVPNLKTSVNNNTTVNSRVINELFLRGQYGLFFELFRVWKAFYIRERGRKFLFSYFQGGEAFSLGNVKVSVS